MPSLSSKDRVSLCRFTFDDGRRCRTPRISSSPDFCHYHAQKEAQSLASEKIGKDLAYFFSGDYLSANDLNAALSRIFVAVARGDIKPRAARTLAYLAQTMLQTLHLAQNEFISACGNSEWHDTVINSINANHKYRFPSSSPSEPQQAQTPPQPPTPSPTHAPASTPVQSASPAPQTPASSAAVSSPQPAIPANQPLPPVPDPAVPIPRSASLNQPAAQSPKRSAPPATQSVPPSRPVAQTRDPYAVHYGPNDRLPMDVKPS